MSERETVILSSLIMPWCCSDVNHPEIQHLGVVCRRCVHRPIGGAEQSRVKSSGGEKHTCSRLGRFVVPARYMCVASKVVDSHSRGASTHHLLRIKFKISSEMENSTTCSGSTAA